MLKLVLNILFIFVSMASFCQLLTNNGATIFSQSNAIITVQGSVKNSGTLNHNGYIIIGNSFFNDSLSSGSGIYDLYGNWYNSGTFVCDTSHVHLKGSVQTISGNSITKFYNLSCEGSAKKILWQNAVVKNQLNLNSLELATMDDTLTVENTSLNAVLFDNVFGSEGFVSSSDIGTFIRNTANSNTYIFPLGSSSGTPRYRYVEITPENSLQNSYALSFINHIPYFDSYDTSLCDINKKFYHKISRVNGVSKALINVYYLPVSDSYYNKLAYKNNNNWSVVNESFLSTAIPYSYLSYPLWDNTNKELILANKGLVISSIHGDSIVCQNQTGQYFSLTYPGFNPVWNTIGGAVTDSSFMSALWNTQGQGMVSLYYQNSLNNCHSNIINYPVYVAELPTADFSFNQSTQQNNNYFSFLDHSTGNINSWNWDFGNNQTSTLQNSQTEYSHDGQYNVSLTVQNNYGCLDTAIKIISIDAAIFIPTAFTPGMDGFNDYLQILYNGNFVYEIKILNRWGQELWKGDQNTMWDGRTKEGAKCSQGTYYYFLKGTMNGMPMEFNGAVELIR